MLMDGKFTPLKQDLAKMQITLNTVSSDEHVPEIKHCICTMKEMCPFWLVLPPIQKPSQENDSGTHLCTELLARYAPTQGWCLARAQSTGYHQWSGHTTITKIVNWNLRKM